MGFLRFAKIRKRCFVSIALVPLHALAFVACSSSDDDSGVPTDSGAPNTNTDGAATDGSASTPSFSVSVPALAVSRGGSASTTLSIQRTNGFTGDINVIVNGLPAGVMAAPLVVYGGQSSGTLHVTAGVDAIGGPHASLVQATSNGITALSVFDVDVGPPPGTVDTSFAGGSVTTSVEGAGEGLLLLADGRIVVAGSGLYGMKQALLAIFHPDGQLDLSFAEGGVSSFGDFTFFGTGAVVQHAGKLVALGEKNNFPATAQILSTGELDTTFGEGGISEQPLGGCTSAAWAFAFVDTEGKIVASTGYRDHSTSDCQALARFDDTGAFDTSFGDPDDAGAQRGYVIFPSASFSPWSQMLPWDSGIFVSGTGGSASTSLLFSSDGASYRTLFTPTPVDCDVGAIRPDSGPVLGCFQTLAAYRADGTLDTSFGEGGYTSLPSATGHPINPRAIIVQNDGRIVVAGYTGVINPGSYQTYLARFVPDGTIDTSFGENGVIDGPDGALTALALQTDGKIIVAGRTSYGDGQVILGRYWP